MAKAKKRKSAKRPKLEAETVKREAAGQWEQILSHVGGLPISALDGKHHPCPKCGGTDRFRLVDSEAGGCLCNQCFRSRNGDGFSAIQWARGISFGEALREVAAYLGIESGQGESEKTKADPAEHLQFKPWNQSTQSLVALWCRHKPPITPEAVQLAGGRLARYRRQYTVVAIPVWGQNLDQAEPVGWAILNTTGGSLPKSGPDGQVDWITKPKLTYGSQPGLCCDPQSLAGAEVVWKLEGITDLLAWLSMPDRPADHAAVTNSSGCGQRPAKWMVEQICGCGRDKSNCAAVNVLHDADLPGQRGALGYDDDHGRHRPGWCEELARSARDCRNVLLPYVTAETHGQDFRDWLCEGNDFSALRHLAGNAESISPKDLQPIESPDDPNRLARVNLDRYATATGGRTIRYWRDEWYVWTKSHYRRITERELKGKIWASVKAEFDRLWREEFAAYQSDKEAGQEDDKGPPKCRKVSAALVANVLGATTGMVTISHHTELHTWLPTRERRDYISASNGIIDVDAMLAGKLDECLLPHSPDWFSATSVPYGFNPHAECPLWLDFLSHNLEGDQQRINLLQEWAGYLLLPDTGEQVFLILEGEGANGKSVYCAGIEAMLGRDNCSSVPLESFGDRFSKTETLGKLANICGDVGELDKVAEGAIKAFASGNTMFFDRKGVGGVSCSPTARLMLACNNRPRFSDRSDGIWRRMLLVPWLRKITKSERVRNMDKATWWAGQGELPGILNWAIYGLERLRTQEAFTECDLMTAAIDDYKIETNSARHFLSEYVIEDADGTLECEWIHGVYAGWAKRSGYHPLSLAPFGREVTKLFPRVDKKRLQVAGKRKATYCGVCMKSDFEFTNGD